MRAALTAWATGGVMIACAQTVWQVDTIRAVQPLPPHETYSFPHVSTPGRPGTGERIHRHLCTDLLEADPDTAGNALFSMVWGNAAWPTPRLHLHTWSVTQPVVNVMDIRFEGEGCGAYCEEFTRHYVYDLRDGSYLAYDSLFTPEGRAAVDDTLDQRWRTIVQRHVKTLTDSILDGGPPADEKEALQEAIDLYTSCTGERTPGHPYIQGIQPLTHAMRFFIPRCGAHAVRPLDDLDVVEIDLPYRWLHARLRPEWRSLFPRN